MTLNQLADIAKKRLTGHDNSMPGSRRLVTMTRETRRKLTAVAKQLSAQLKIHVFPMQVAAMIVEDSIGDVT